MPATVTNSATIASGGTTSGAIDLALVDHLSEIHGIVIPSAFTGTSISFEVSPDDGTYQALYNDAGTLAAVTVSAGRTYGMRQDLRAVLARWRFLKIVSNAAEGAERTITLVTK